MKAFPVTCQIEISFDVKPLSFGLIVIKGWIMKPADIKPDPISAGIIVTSGSRVFVPISSPEMYA